MAKTITILTFVLVVFGLVILSSAGIVEGYKKFDSPYYYLTHQLLYGVLPGAFLFFLLSRINYKFWRKVSLPLLIGVIGLLVLVFVPQFSYGFRGAQRWIDFGLFRFQPSELLKLALVIYLAAWFSSRQPGSARRGSYKTVSVLIPFLLVLGFTGLLLISQPDMGTLIVVTIISIAMYFFAGAKFSHFLIMILVLAILLGALAVFEPYRFDRLKAFINPNIDKQGTSYHINQALIGIGSGGLFGRGFGQSQQKFNYLPEPVGDSIFAIYVEELGFVGASVLIALFVWFVLILAQIARRTSDSFGTLLVLGIAIWITSQSFINIAAISGLVPLTGIPLPFISFGSSALVSLLAGLGIVANIAKKQ